LFIFILLLLFLEEFINESEEEEDYSISIQNAKYFDEDFYDDMIQFEKNFTEIGSQVSPTDLTLITHQAEDAYQLGCLIAELFDSVPLRSHSDNLHHFSLVVDHVYKTRETVPLPVKRLICLLIHPNKLIRPRVYEFLFFGTSIDSDILKNNDFGRMFCGKSIEKIITGNDQYNKMLNYRKDLIFKYCFSLFPSYFESLYSFLFDFKLYRQEV
jgi:hypothetical protein